MILCSLHTQLTCLICAYVHLIHHIIKRFANCAFHLSLSPDDVSNTKFARVFDNDYRCQDMYHVVMYVFVIGDEYPPLFLLFTHNNFLPYSKTFSHHIIPYAQHQSNEKITNHISNNKWLEACRSHWNRSTNSSRKYF